MARVACGPRGPALQSLTIPCGRFLAVLGRDSVGLDAARHAPAAGNWPHRRSARATPTTCAPACPRLSRCRMKAGVSSTIDQAFHKHGYADRENDPYQHDDCYFELHVHHRRNYAHRCKSLLRYSGHVFGATWIGPFGKLLKIAGRAPCFDHHDAVEIGEIALATFCMQYLR
jgi:hypothetical protein